jgi:hypothetical protein
MGLTDGAGLCILSIRLAADGDVDEDGLVTDGKVEPESWGCGDFEKGNSDAVCLGLVIPANVRDLRKSDGARMVELRVVTAVLSSVSSDALSPRRDRKGEDDVGLDNDLSTLLVVASVLFSIECLI